MIRIHSLASAEIEEAFIWYTKHSSRLADNFSASLAEAFVKIQHQPLLYACFVEDYRFIRIKGFPYLIIFSLEPDDRINVYAVMHESREPGYWQNRNL